MADDRKFDEWAFAKADGDPNWTEGSETFDYTWTRAEDLLRFHKGEGFTIKDRKNGSVGPKRTLKEIPDYLKADLLHFDNHIFEVTSLKDGYNLIFRRRVVQSPLLGDDLLKYGREFLGTPYKLGWASTTFIDCSGLTMREAGKFGIELYHQASVQWAMFGTKDGFLRIDRKDIKIGDFLVHWGGAHISTYAGKDEKTGYDTVLDAQPDGTDGPPGWGPILAGCRIRPMVTRWYTDWEHVNSVCRIIRINGKP